MAGASVRAQKAFALDYCAASFVTEGEASQPAALTGYGVAQRWQRAESSLARSSIEKGGLIARGGLEKGRRHE